MGVRGRRDRTPLTTTAAGCALALTSRCALWSRAIARSAGSGIPRLDLTSGTPPGHEGTCDRRIGEMDRGCIASGIVSTRRVPIRFVGVWDTVSSVIVPRPDRLYLPSLQLLPYTRTNSYVEIFRQAIAIAWRKIST